MTKSKIENDVGPSPSIIRLFLVEYRVVRIYIRSVLKFALYNL
jgi:hypothetical protein